jgi:hypothetical protein
MKLNTVKVSLELLYPDFVDLQQRAEAADISVEEMAKQLIIERLMGVA